MPRPDLQVVTRYTSCTHMDRSPLLYVDVSCQCYQPKWPGDLDLWPFNLECSVRVTCDVSYLYANFGLPRPLCSRFKSDVCDRLQTDVRQHHRLMPRLLWRRHRRFWRATQNCVAPYIDLILHRNRFWAISIASGSVRLWDLRSCCMVLSHVMRGRPRGLLQFLNIPRISISY